MAGGAAASLLLGTRPFLLRRINAPFSTFRGAWLDSCLTFLIFSHLLTSRINAPAHLHTGRAAGKGEEMGLGSPSRSLGTSNMDTVQLGGLAKFLPLTVNAWVPAAA